jgi:hypothetical protein
VPTLDEVVELTGFSIVRDAVSGKQGSSCPAPRIHQGVARWMIDSGCGYDLIGARDADRYPDITEGLRLLRSSSPQPMAPQRHAPRSTLAWTNSINQCPRGYWASTPAVLSLGRRCMHEGFSFVWPSGDTPYLIRPDGMIVRLKVIGDIPYIVPNASICQPVSPQSDITFPRYNPKQRPANPGSAMEPDDSIVRDAVDRSEEVPITVRP